MVNQRVAADHLANLFNRAVVCHQFVWRRHVNAVHIGKAHRRCCAGQVNFSGPRVAGHLHDLPAGGAAHDRVVDQQHIAAFELAGNHVEFLTHRFFAHALPRHDEGAAHIAVFDKAFAVRNTQQMRQLGGAGPTRFRNGDDHVDLIGRHGGHHTLGQGFAQVQTRLVDRNTVEHRVRSGQVNKFKNAGVERGMVSTGLRVHIAVHVDKHGFAGGNVTVKDMPGAFQRNGFAGHHDSFTTLVLAMTNTQGPDAKRVAKRQQAMARNQRHHGVGPTDALVHAAHRCKNIFWRQRQAARGFFQLMGQHIEQHF